MEMKKLLYRKNSKVFCSAVLLLIAAVAVLGFSSLTKAKNSISQGINGYNAEKLYEYRTPYLGDASKVGNIVSNLPFAQYKSGISLQTDSQPYEITVNYIIKPGELSNVNEQLAKNAAVIFSLVENVEGVIFSFDDGIGVYRYPFTREYVNWVLDRDTRESSFSFEKFRDELLPMIMQRDWTNVELYIWRDKKTKDVYYTLFSGTNTTRTNEMIYDFKAVTKDLKEINKKLSWYVCGTLLTIRHDSSFTKEEMLKLSDDIIFPGTSRSIGVFGDLLQQQENSDISDKLEKNLAVILSSPKVSSNPSDYIKAHQNEYHNILKMGDAALNYMLSCFKENNATGLRGHIMMELCQEILGDRNNVHEGDYKSPGEWYSKLAPYTAKNLPKFKYTGNDTIEQLVYSAALQHYDRYNKKDTLTMVAPRIFGTYEQKNELRIFTTVYYSSFRLYDKTLSDESSGVVPSAIIYTKNSDGTYTFKEYVEAMDGAYFAKSIEDFCKPRKDISENIMKHYGNYGDLFDTMRQNIKNYLNANGLTGINIKQSDGTVIPIS